MKPLDIFKQWFKPQGNAWICPECNKKNPICEDHYCGGKDFFIGSSYCSIWIDGRDAFVRMSSTYTMIELKVKGSEKIMIDPAESSYRDVMDKLNLLMLLQ